MLSLFLVEKGFAGYFPSAKRIKQNNILIGDF
jgi:hypothetical protein